MRFALASILCLGGAVAHAVENPTKPVLLALNKALTVARQDSEECRNKALAGLKDARDAVEMTRGKPTVEAFTKARRAVEDTLDAIGSACTSATTTAMGEAQATLGAAVEALGEAAAAPSPAEKTAAERRACWNYKNDWSPVDPACHTPREGHLPLAKVELDKILAKLLAADDRFAKVAVVQEELGYSRKRYLSSAQLALILQRLFNDIDRLEAVKITARWLVDPANAGKALVAIADTAVRRDALATITEEND